MPFVQNVKKSKIDPPYYAMLMLKACDLLSRKIVCLPAKNGNA
jgi:hypothetical protein